MEIREPAGEKKHRTMHLVDLIQEPCKKICSESSKALKALSCSIKDMTPPSSVNLHVENARAAVEDLKTRLSHIPASQHTDLLAILPAATVASILIEVVGKMEKVAESVEELSRGAGFKEKKEKLAKPSPILHRSTVTPICTDDEVVIDISEVDQVKELPRNQQGHHSLNGEGS
uniref:Aluminum-activated malate transporter n=1 Tax=Kalanchoe fedtschenkoi TaxID=63787 RepID=A0A7N0UW75_KALFE